MVWWIVGASLSGAACLAMLALWVPVELRFSLVKDDQWRIEARIAWLYGLVSFRVGPSGKPKPERKPKKKKRGKGGFGRVTHTGRTPGLLPASLRLVRRSVKAFRVDNLAIDLRYGTGDPVTTGILLGPARLAQSLVDRAPSAHVAIEPEWTDATLRGTASGAVRLTPIKLMAAGALFALSPTAFRAGARMALGR